MVTILALAVAPSGSGTEPIVWGPTVSGLRLGAAFGSDPSKPTLRITLQNVGSDFQELVLGHEAGGKVYDSLKFIATIPDGKQHELLHRSVYGAVAGLILPFSVRLNAGETYELEFSLKDIIYASRTTFTLDALAKQGYSIRVRFEAGQSDANGQSFRGPGWHTEIWRSFADTLMFLDSVNRDFSSRSATLTGTNSRFRRPNNRSNRPTSCSF